MCRYRCLSECLWLLAGFFLCSAAVGCSRHSVADDDSYVIRPAASRDADDVKWADYLFTHLEKRTDLPGIVNRRSGEGSRVVWVDVCRDLETDFRITREAGHDVRLQARTPEAMLWLQYQFMRLLGDADARFHVSDLPCALLTAADTCGNFAFAYRDVYLPTNQDPDMTGILGLHNVGTEWAIWGHNLAKAVDKKRAPREVYAQVDGRVNENQYCFSSDRLYTLVEEYLVENYGDGAENPYNVAILPNDNRMVCQCARCRAAGCRPGNAEPAVTAFVCRLARRFPGHRFFTSSYLTTDHIPAKHLPDNVGVLVSTLDYPQHRLNVETGSGLSFFKKIQAWREKTPIVYVWDYVNNFDDYLTPYPVPTIMKQRLQAYRRAGVAGIFLNGSGFDYSSFEELHTILLSALLICPDADVEYLADDYFARNFPVAGHRLAAFYRQLLRAADARKLSLYGGVADAVSYLPADTFAVFYNRLLELLPRTEGEETVRLRTLVDGLTFTRLEIARHTGCDTVAGFAVPEGKAFYPRPETNDWLARLGEACRDFRLTTYSESGGLIADYVENWRKYVLCPPRYENLLLGTEVHVQGGGTDERLRSLTDGSFGLPDSYHFGWHIYPAAPLTLSLYPVSLAGRTELRIGFLHMPVHRITLPSRVEVLSADSVLTTLTVGPASDLRDTQIVFATGVIASPPPGPLTLRVVPVAEQRGTMAFDEVQLNTVRE